MTDAPSRGTLARWVENRALAAGTLGPAPEGLLPDRTRLEDARGLVERHRGLVPCALARVSLDGRPIWLALESMQTTGSFKVRGALMAIEALRRDAGRGDDLRVVTASAGNHGAGVAYAAKLLGVKATVVVPKTAARTKVAKISAYGATVIEANEPGYDGAEREAMALADAERVPFLSAFDDVDVVAGNGGSLGFDIVRALGAVPAEVICPVGGGGIATGLACAFGVVGAQPREGASHHPVVGVQIERSPAFAMSLDRGTAVTELPPATTLAEGLEGGLPARAFARLHHTVRGALVVDEDMIASAMRFAVRELGLVLEGSAAAALAAAMHDPRPPREGERVVVLTGRNVDRERLAEVC